MSRMGDKSLEQRVVGGPPVNTSGELTPAEEAATRAVTMSGNQVIGSALRHDRGNSEKPTRYRITKGGAYMQQHVKFEIREGKVVDGHNYNLKDMRSQGIKMVEIKDGEDEVL